MRSAITKVSLLLGSLNQAASAMDTENGPKMIDAEMKSMDLNDEG